MKRYSDVHQPTEPTKACWLARARNLSLVAVVLARGDAAAARLAAAGLRRDAAARLLGHRRPAHA
eukprot:3995760-Prymnesium_polylepis.2